MAIGEIVETRERAEAGIVSAARPQVRLADPTASGLARLLQQYLEQSLAELATTRRRAARLRGRVAVTATDYDVTATLDFRGDEIVIHDGANPPLDASIRAPQRTLLELLRGDGRPLVDHLRGRLRISTSWRRPFLPLQLHRVMRIPPSHLEIHRRRRVLLAGLGVAALLAAALLYLGS